MSQKIENTPKYAGSTTIKMIQSTDGKTIKIQIPQGLVESGIKPEDVRVEEYTQNPLEAEDYTHLKNVADKLNLTVDQVAEIAIGKLLKELEKVTRHDLSS